MTRSSSIHHKTTKGIVTAAMTSPGQARMKDSEGMR
jgi:hypothetical protein